MTLSIQALRRFLADERGATAIEYALIGGMIALAIVSAVSTLGNNTAATFNQVSTEAFGA